MPVVAVPSNSSKSLRSKTGCSTPRAGASAGKGVERWGLEGADYARGHIQAWLSKGIGSDANAIPEKSAQKIFRAADQILRAGRADAGDEEHKQ